MVGVGLQVTLEAKPGKEEDVVRLLQEAVSLVRQEPQTTGWYALRLGPSRFGIFDTFADEAAFQAHLNGPVPPLVAKRAPALFEDPPAILRCDILAAK